MEDGTVQYTDYEKVNVYEIAEDLQDGFYGNVEVTDDETEMFLYEKMCEYCDAYKAYLAKNGLAA